MTAKRIGNKACRFCYGPLYETNGKVECADCGSVFESIETAEATKRGGARPGSGRLVDPVTGKTIRKNVTLDALTIAKLEAHGDGNLSLGIRKMAREFFTPA